MSKNILNTYENISLTSDNYSAKHRVYISIPSKKNKTTPPKVQIENISNSNIFNKEYNNNYYLDSAKKNI